LTGHGNVAFSNSDLRKLRSYLTGGGFLPVDDNFGMDQYNRREIKRLFPDQELLEIPPTHAIFKAPSSLPGGIHKCHELGGTPPRAYGICVEKRLVLLYTTETDVGDGWEDPEVHNNPQDVREKALKMGTNLLYYVFTQ